MNRVETKLFRYFIFLLNILFLSCKHTPKQKTGIIGRYINATLIEKSLSKMLDSIPFYCTEMNFFSVDSVHLINGIEEYNLGYEKVGERYFLLNASFKGKMEFVLNQDSSITLVDHSWTNIPTNSNFRKIPEDSTYSFEFFLNKQLVAGEYALFEAGKCTHRKIVLLENGLIIGHEDYFSYFICYAGDCFEQAIPFYNIICFRGKSGYRTFGFKVNFDRKTLIMYDLSGSVKCIKRQFCMKNVVFELRRLHK